MVCLFATQRLLLLAVAVALCGAVDRSKFRTCHDTGFCRRQRERGPLDSSLAYQLDMQSVRQSSGQVAAQITAEGIAEPLNLMLSFLASGSIRVQISEKSERWQPVDILMPDGMKLSHFKQLSAGDASFPETLRSVGSSVLAFSTNDGSTQSAKVLVVHPSPLKLELYVDGVLQIAANERSLLHYEQRALPEARRSLVEEQEQKQQKEQEVAVDKHKGKEIVDYGEDGLAIYSDGTREEKVAVSSANDDSSTAGDDGSALDGDQREFQRPDRRESLLDVRGDSFGGHHDTMKLGPTAVGIDISFPFAKDVYGLPEHTSPLSLPSTTAGSAGISPRYKDPYRLYNLDVFEYELDEPMALYGGIPVLYAHALSPKTNQGMTAGVFWFNPSETFVDVADGGSPQSSYKQSHWISESGNVDMFFLPGPTPADVFHQYTALTGRQQLPPIFALGYHQCRWNYRDERDVAGVEQKFEELDYPMDVIWLDIEHTDGKRYFTWDKQLFPHPKDMIDGLSKHGRKMVSIVDPHIKRDNHFPVHVEATKMGYYTKNKDGSDFDGWCWPGSSSYLDFTNPKVREWWAEQFNYDKYIGSTPDLYTWNDMNEPSVFNGPEISMPKDAMSTTGIEHREWHNMYGMYMQMATSMGLVGRSTAESERLADPTKQQRSFVLTRSFWAGSQRHGAMWTGDNTAQWGHFKIAAPMIMSVNLGGISFSGSDVGGFFGEPGAELFTRWYFAGAFTPFFRSHAHHDTKRREPWLFGEPHTTIHRTATMVRYTLLPLWYTLFFLAYESGMPVMRPMFVEFPNDPQVFQVDDQWMVGDSLLVKPVTDAGASTAEVLFPAKDSTGAVWYDFNTMKIVPETVKQTNSMKLTVTAPLEILPVFIRSGKIIPRKMRLRRSATLMYYDPYTLVIAPSLVVANGVLASGLLYLDDEKSLAHETVRAFAVRELTYMKSSPKTFVVRNANAKRPQGAVQPDPSALTPPSNTVERIEILGQSAPPTKVRLVLGDKDISASAVAATSELSFTYDVVRQLITIKKPDCKVIEDWSVVVEF